MVEEVGVYRRRLYFSAPGGESNRTEENARPAQRMRRGGLKIYVGFIDVELGGTECPAPGQPWRAK
ncbi:MAG: hypothetical protein ACE5GL_06505 [Calditrichia bacterium]